MSGSYSDRSATQDISGSKDTLVEISVKITKVLPTESGSMYYYYRVVAENEMGISYGEEKSLSLVTPIIDCLCGVSGKIIDAVSKEGIVNATIIGGEGSINYTNKLGYYVWDNGVVPCNSGGTYQLTASADGYEPLTQYVNVQPCVESTLNFELQLAGTPSPIPTAVFTPILPTVFPNGTPSPVPTVIFTPIPPTVFSTPIYGDINKDIKMGASPRILKLKKKQRGVITVIMEGDNGVLKEDFDVNNEYNTSTYKYTAQSAGYYLVTVSGYMSTQGGEAGLVGIRKNGTTIIGRKWSQDSCNSDVHPICTDLVYLNAGDYIEGVARHTASAARSLNYQKELVYMNVHRVDAIPVGKRIWYQSPIDKNGTFKFRIREVNGNTPFDLLVIKSYGAINYGWPYVNGTDGHIYRCKTSHTSADSNRPITGASWSSYWERSYDGVEEGIDWSTNTSYKAYNDSGLIEYYKTTLPVVAIGNSYVVSPQPAPSSSASSLRALQDATNYRLLYPSH